MQTFYRPLLFLFAIIFVFQISHVEAFGQSAENGSNIRSSSASGSVSQMNLTIPLKQCVVYRPGENETNTINYASDNVKEIYSITPAGILQNIDLNTGGPKWITDLGVRNVSNFGFDADSLFVVVENNQNYYLKSIGRNTGITGWQVKLDLSANPETIDEKSPKDEKSFKKKENLFINIFNRIITVLSSDSIFRFDAGSGHRLSVNSINGQSMTAPYFSGGRIIFAVTEKKILSVTAEAEQPRTYASNGSVSALADSGELIIYGNKQGSVTALRSESGKINWNARSGAEISDLTVTNFGLLVSSRDNYIYMLSIPKGKLVWKIRTSGRISSKPLVAGKYAIFVGKHQPEAFIVDLEIGKTVNRLTLETEDYFTGESFFALESPVFATRNGLITFKDASVPCR